MPSVRDYRPHTRPFAHQWECLEKGGNKLAFALLMEAGTAKTKIILDNTAWLFERGVISGLLIAAPNDVADQWVDEQIPLHLPPRIKYRAVVWDSRSKTVERRALELANRPIAGYLHILSVNHEAFAVKRVEKLLTRFLKAHKSLIAVDEAHEFKSMKAARTKALHRLGEYSMVRRILTGTPFEQPFDLYAQFFFLDPRILGFDSFLTFKHHYGIFEKQFTKMMCWDRRTGGKVPRLVQYESLQQYQRLEELYARIDPYSYRKRLIDCTDLPEKLHAILPTHMSDAQSALYRQIKSEGIALLQAHEEGRPVELMDLSILGDEDLIEALKNRPDRVSASIKLVINLRLQQCMGGFVTDDARVTRCIEGRPLDLPRMQTIVEHIKGVLRSDPEGKVIVWAQFRAELHALYKALGDSLMEGVLLIDGTVTGKERTWAIEQFKAPKSPDRVLIAHQRTMGVGQNLQVARTMYYYSNGWRWIAREQSERRVHRVGQTGTVRIYDLQAKDAPLDKRLLENFATKGDLVQTMMTWTPQQMEALC